MKSKKMKYQLSASKVILCMSIVGNIALFIVLAMVENRSHVLARALERRGYITLDDSKDLNYWTRVAWTNTIKKMHTEFDVAFFGNSITCGSDFQQFFPNKKIINLGLPGDNLIGMKKRISMLEASNPKKIFIMAGTNDLVHNDVETYKTNYIRLIDEIHNVMPNAQIYVQSVLPTNTDFSKKYAPNKKVIQANKMIENIADSLNFKYINIYDSYIDSEGELIKDLTRDGVHLYPTAYDKWAKVIEKYVYE